MKNDIFKNISSLESQTKQKILKILLKKNINKCPYCHSEKIIKNGSEIVQGKKRQKYICKYCKKNFRESTRTLMEKTRIKQKEIKKLFQYFQEDMSTREIKRNKMNISHVTVSKWRNRIEKILLTIDIEML